MQTRRKSPKVALVTGGPTRTYLDDIRFISNFSTGSTAVGICNSLKAAGWSVFFVAGPLSTKEKLIPGITVIPVETNREMEAEVLRVCKQFKPTLAVLAAAVLDFRAVRATGKKRSNKSWTVKLLPDRKIVEVLRNKYPEVARVGFKLEAKQKSSPQQLAKALLRKNDYFAVCVNYRNEISAKSHPALMMRNDKLTLRSRRSNEIGKGIARLVRPLLNEMQAS